MPRLENVFGVRADSASASYVDRGGLDLTFSTALVTDKHVVVHGGSKQGKSWLRKRKLSETKSLLVQCSPASSVETILHDALGIAGAREEQASTHTASVTAQLQAEVAATEPASGGGKSGLQIGSNSAKSTTSIPIGQSSGSIRWVADQLLAAKRRLVIEDFHYLSEDVQKLLAFLIKALGEYGVYVVVVGVWPQNHMLTYFNGDLDGRATDIELRWEDEELQKVLDLGCRALRIRIHPAVASDIVHESYGSVGLLQRLAEEYCRRENVTTRRWWNRTLVLDSREACESALEAVAIQMEGRYQTFADNFVLGLRRLPDGLTVYRYMLQAVTAASDEELLRGLDSAVLLNRINALDGGEAIRQSDLTQALERIDRLQSKIMIKPVILTYSRSRRAISVADRSFCFYRRHARPDWPWNRSDLSLENDLSDEDPLNLDH